MVQLHWETILRILKKLSTELSDPALPLWGTHQRQFKTNSHKKCIEVLFIIAKWVETTQMSNKWLDQQNVV